MADQVFPIGACKSARSALTTEQLLYAVVKTLGGRVSLNAETLTQAVDENSRVFDDLVSKEGHNYLVLATEKRLL